MSSVIYIMAFMVDRFIRKPNISIYETMLTFIYSVLPSLVSLNFLRQPRARAIFLHSNVLYNNIICYWGRKKHWGGGERQNISEYDY